MRHSLLSTRLALACFAGLLIGTLAACGSSVPVVGRVSGSDGMITSPRGQWKMAALASLHGAPESVQTQMMQQISRQAVRQGIVLRSDPGATVDYTLRGYLLVEPGHGSSKSGNQGSSKVLYVWDVLDQRGNRVNRVAGEEMVATVSGSTDRWAAVSPAILALIADKAVDCLGAALGGAPAGTSASALGAPAPG